MSELSPVPTATFRISSVELDDPRATELRDLLDGELDERYRDREADAPPELAEARTEALRIHPEQVVATLLAIDDDARALGHVMLRRLGDEWELKRLVVADAARGRGVGRALVAEVVAIAREGGARRVILQTGEPQHESLGLYRSMGFTPIPVYEPYAETMPRSLCFELLL